MMRGELEELGEVVAGGENQHWQDVTDESTLVGNHDGDGDGDGDSDGNDDNKSEYG